MNMGRTVSFCFLYERWGLNNNRKKKILAGEIQEKKKSCKAKLVKKIQAGSEKRSHANIEA